MIAESNRLSSDRQIKKVIQKGAVKSGSFFRMKAMRNPRLKGESRFTVIVGKKISSKAVVRNRIKRRAKAVFAQEIGKIPGYDIVVFPNRNLENADFEKIVEDTKKCLKELASFS